MNVKCLRRIKVGDRPFYSREKPPSTPDRWETGARASSVRGRSTERAAEDFARLRSMPSGMAIGPNDTYPTSPFNPNEGEFVETLLKKMISGSSKIARAVLALGLPISSLLILSCAHRTPTVTAPPSPAPATGRDSATSTSTSTEVRSPTSTSTSTEVRSPTSTSTQAYTAGNFTVTVTGGAGAGDTTVVIEVGVFDPASNETVQRTTDTTGINRQHSQAGSKSEAEVTSGGP